jgi:hypothetical protein
MLVRGSVFADAYVPLMSQPSLADNYRMINYHREAMAAEAIVYQSL